jgi:CheY-like chemotaxis protein
VSKRVTLTWEVGDVPMVKGDRAQVQQVLMNLITNASEAIGDADGRIAVRVTGLTLDERAVEREVPGQGLRAGRLACLEVEDSGCGMPADLIERIFDPFFSTKQPGRGLGLSAVRGILKGHQAAIQVTSRPGQGTRVRIFWPASESAATVAPARAASAGAEARGTGTVLLVDDEPLVRRAVSGVIESFGFTVIEAEDGARAIELYRREHARIAWVLMDLTMPRLDGHQTFLALRRIDPAAFVVLMSGWAEDELARQFAAAPPNGFLPKPFSGRELEERLRRLGLLGAPRAHASAGTSS